MKWFRYSILMSLFVLSSAMAMRQYENFDLKNRAIREIDSTTVRAYEGDGARYGTIELRYDWREVVDGGKENAEGWKPRDLYFVSDRSGGQQGLLGFQFTTPPPSGQTSECHDAICNEFRGF